MASKASPPSSSRPPGVPDSGGSKFVILAVALLGLMGAVVVWKMSQKPSDPPAIVGVDAAPSPVHSGRNLDEDVPPPPPVEETREPDAGKQPVAATPSTFGCDAKKCAGTSGSELENALQFRVKQAHRCYDNALAQDPALRGKITVAVRVGTNGQVCSAGIASNEMGSSQVASCVSGYFRGASVPAPRGGCVDVNIPINFVPRQ